mgnify:CR=1 FL=1|jgi:hypothetical protein
MNKKDIEKEIKERLEWEGKSKCRDCGTRVSGCGSKNGDFNASYMLKDDLWTEIIANEDESSEGRLCIICAQLRAGRKFVPKDFKAVPLNLRPNGMITLLFPVEFKEHLSAFVGE